MVEKSEVKYELGDTDGKIDHAPYLRRSKAKNKIKLAHPLLA